LRASVLSDRQQEKPRLAPGAMTETAARAARQSLQFRMRSSTRRFLARPPAVALSARG
jgi:hypothetical protein